MSSLVIFGSIKDPHVTRVAERLLDRSVDVYFFDLEMDVSAHATLPDDAPIHIELTACNYATGGLEALPQDCEAAWLRYKWPKQPVVTSQDQERYHRLTEFEHFFYQFVQIKRLRAFNSLDAIRRMDSKLAQLKLASEIGFAIPPTIASNEPDAIKAFVTENAADCIIKVLYKAFMPPAADGSRKGFTLMTNPMTQGDLNEHEDASFSFAPSLYQSRIDKAFELRGVATSDRCAAYKIDSQNSELGKLDWRLAQFEKIFEQYSLDRGAQLKFQEFIKRSGLHYGVFDAALTRGGELVFIECNADGQWAWLERACGTSDITDALVELAETLVVGDAPLVRSA